MNDRHPSGDYPADPAAEFSYAAYDMAAYEQSAYGSYETGGYATGSHATTGYDGWSTGSYDSIAAPYGDGDPLFGSLPGAHDTGTYSTDGYGTYGGGSPDTGQYDTAMWASAGYQGTPFIPHQQGPEQAGHGYPAAADGTAQWDVSAYDTTGWNTDGYGQYGENGAYDTGSYEAVAYDTGSYDAVAYETSPYQTGAYETGQWEQGLQGDGHHPGGHEQPVEAHAAYAAYEQPYVPQEPFQPYEAHESYAAYEPYQAYEPYESEEPHPAYDGHEPLNVHDGPGGPDGPEPTEGHAPFPHIPEAEPEPGAAAPVPGYLVRSRRRSPKRSALLSVAAPSVAVLGVAGIAAASVNPDTTEEPVQAAPDTSSVQTSAANSKLDTQLAGLSEDADDFANRASRTQERIDLKKRQEAERKRKAAEAARREALRPKFALPVSGTGISAGYGAAGINWMSVHTGVDFPVSYGTPVKAATDGTVTTKWDLSYGNMMIVTAADGTETWYCHLSSTRIRSGSVQAGDVIGYSGNSGNSTGPHLHFEVRPGGGDAIDPLPWFRSHGLEP